MYGFLFHMRLCGVSQKDAVAWGLRVQRRLEGLKIDEPMPLAAFFLPPLEKASAQERSVHNAIYSKAEELSREHDSPARCYTQLFFFSLRIQSLESPTVLCQHLKVFLLFSSS